MVQLFAAEKRSQRCDLREVAVEGGLIHQLVQFFAAEKGSQHLNLGEIAVKGGLIYQLAYRIPVQEWSQLNKIVQMNGLLCVEMLLDIDSRFFRRNQGNDLAQVLQINWGSGLVFPLIYYLLHFFCHTLV